MSNGVVERLECGARYHHTEFGTVWIEALLTDFDSDEIYVVSDVDNKLYLVFRHDLTLEVD